MSAPHTATFQIKRRISASGIGTLLPGELAHNEFENRLYICGTTTASAIAGEGKLVTINGGTQSVSANTIFSGIVALSSCTASSPLSTTNNTTVATTQFVQQVFAYIDGGTFEDGPPADGVGKYWFSENSSEWYSYGDYGNWYTDQPPTLHAASLPDSITDVVILGSHNLLINIGNNEWVTPNTIDVASCTGVVTFYSTTPANIACDITGSPTFAGSAHYGV